MRSYTLTQVAYFSLSLSLSLSFSLLQMIATISNTCTSVNNNHSNTSVRRNSFSEFVKSLLLLVSPSNNHDNSNSKQEDIEKRSPSLFEDMYVSFPAFEEQEESTGCHPQPSLIVGTSRIMCWIAADYT